MARAEREEEPSFVDGADPYDQLDTRPGGEFPTDGGRADDGAPALVTVLECRRVIARGYRLMLDGIDEVVVGRGAAARVERDGRTAKITVEDHETSRRHLAVQRRSQGWRVVDLGSRNGTLLNGDSVRAASLHHGDLIEAGGAMLLFVESAPSGSPRDRELVCDAAVPAAFRTLNVALEGRIEQVIRIAPSSVPVLVRGETGTGKELMARAIHDASGRRGRFIAVNCGALPRNLVESELFGHRRGAFSGASEDRDGLIRRAHLGTLFLDEIAELPPDSQAALLRVLQDGEVRPVGASEAVQVDIRVVAATHQDLSLRIANGRFRPDLYGRIAGFEIELPPLRDRREDLGMLIATTLSGSRDRGDPRSGRRPGGAGRDRPSGSDESPALSRAAARALLRYAWPLNIRELEQALRSAAALCGGSEIGLPHLPEAIRTYQPPAVLGLGIEDRLLRDRVISLLQETDGNIAAVARALERAPTQIRRWCRRLRIDLARYRKHGSS